jgi:hypothetical protein
MALPPASRAYGPEGEKGHTLTRGTTHFLYQAVY